MKCCRWWRLVLMGALLLGCPMCVHANPGKWAQKAWKAGTSLVVKSKFWRELTHTRTWRVWEYRIDRVTPSTGTVVLVIVALIIGKLGTDKVRDVIREKNKTILPQRRKKKSKLSAVGVAVVAPEEVKRGEDMMIQVVGNVERLLDKSVPKAMALDERNQAKLRGQCSFMCRQNDKIVFRLSLEGISLDDDTQSVEWHESDFRVQFMAHAPEKAAIGTHAGKLLIFVKDTPVGQVGFVTNVVRSKKLYRRKATTTATSFKNYFISYSSKDLNMVVGCLQGMRLADKDIVRHSFLDKMFLEPGKRYEPEIYDYIDNKADVFLLFWSKNAAASEWVKKEYTRALQRQKRDAHPAVRRPEIVPVPLESPIPPPPAELSDIHFGDVFVALKGGGNGMA